MIEPIKSFAIFKETYPLQFADTESMPNLTPKARTKKQLYPRHDAGLNVRINSVLKEKYVAICAYNESDIHTELDIMISRYVRDNMNKIPALRDYD